MKCRLCMTACDLESPETVYGLNPNTFRNATMHWFCFEVALEDLKGVDARRPDLFSDRQDEYLDRIQTWP